MGSDDDREYFMLRARQERATAAECEDRSVALTHLSMAGEYERKVADSRPILKIALNSN